MLGGVAQRLIRNIYNVYQYSVTLSSPTQILLLLPGEKIGILMRLEIPLTYQLYPLHNIRKMLLNVLIKGNKVELTIKPTEPVTQLIFSKSEEQK